MNRYALVIKWNDEGKVIAAKNTILTDKFIENIHNWFKNDPTIKTFYIMVQQKTVAQPLKKVSGW